MALESGQCGIMDFGEDSMSALEKLWNSTEALYERFGLDARSTPPSKRRKFLVEEVEELTGASSVLDFHREVERLRGGNIEAALVGNLVEEAADVIVTTMGLLQSHGIDIISLEYAMQKVADKNDAKPTRRTNSSTARLPESRRSHEAATSTQAGSPRPPQTGARRQAP